MTRRDFLAGQRHEATADAFSPGGAIVGSHGWRSPRRPQPVVGGEPCKGDRGGMPQNAESQHAVAPDSTGSGRRGDLHPWLTAAAPPGLRQDAAETPLLHFSARAMATSFTIMLPFGTLRAREIADDALAVIQDLERQLTVFNDRSEVSRLNRLAARTTVPLEPRLFELLKTAIRISNETGGAFDITSGPLIKAWGFFQREGRTPTNDELTEALVRVGYQYLQHDPATRSIHFRRPGMEINLGSIGKGYALDRAAEILRQNGVTSALLHGGTSSLLAVGSPPGQSAGWPVGVKHPWEPDRRLSIIWLRDQALATSAATHQHFRYNERILGHLIDPRTGRPAEGMASATAVAPLAAEADALSTAFFILEVDGTREYCERHSGVRALLLENGPTAEPIAFLP